MLDINGAAVLTQAIAFVLLALFVAKVILPPVSGMVEGRQREIETTLNEIAADRKAMEKTRAEYEQRLANIEAEARERISGAVKQAQEEASAILTKARDEAAAQHGRAMADIDQERRKAVAEIRSEMTDLAVLAAGKILQREINPAVHRELIGDFIQDVSARN